MLIRDSSEMQEDSLPNSDFKGRLLMQHPYDDMGFSAYQVNLKAGQQLTLKGFTQSSVLGHTNYSHAYFCIQGTGVQSMQLIRIIRIIYSMPETIRFIRFFSKTHLKSSRILIGCADLEFLACFNIESKELLLISFKNLTSIQPKIYSRTPLFFQNFQFPIFFKVLKIQKPKNKQQQQKVQTQQKK